jgi:hypothetical protein
MGAGWARRVRRRDDVLAWHGGELRAGHWARREARRRQLDAFRRAPVLLVGFSGGIAITGIALGVVLPPWVGGFFCGVLLSLAVALPASFLLQVSGSAPVMMGDTAEQWTSQELSRLTRCGWVRVDHIPLNHGDIDHALLGAHEAFAFETKWSAAGWDLSDAADERLKRAARQASRSARRLRIFLGSETVGLAVGVKAIVVLWGHANGAGPTRAVVDGVTCLKGKEGVRALGRRAA